MVTLASHKIYFAQVSGQFILRKQRSNQQYFIFLIEQDSICELVTFRINSTVKEFIAVLNVYL